MTRSNWPSALCAAMVMGAVAVGAGCGDDDADGSGGAGAAGPSTTGPGSTTGSTTTGPGGGAGGEGGGMTMQPPSAESQAILTQIAGYGSWPAFSTARELSNDHMEMYQITHYNTTAEDAMEDGATEFPDGSIFVKDQFPMASGGDSMAITVMVKQSDTWWWFMGSPDGSMVAVMDGVPVEGAVMMCITCHDDAAIDGVFQYE